MWLWMLSSAYENRNKRQDMVLCHPKANTPLAKSTWACRMPRPMTGVFEADSPPLAVEGIVFRCPRAATQPQMVTCSSLARPGIFLFLAVKRRCSTRRAPC